MSRGGRREGAGRKKTEPTKRISVPESLVSEVESMVAAYKDKESEKPFPKSLLEFIEKLPEYQNDLESISRIAVLFEDWEYVKRLPRQHRKLIIKIMQKS